MYSYGPPHMAAAKAGRPARTYIQQLCEDTGCCLEYLSRAKNDREECRERARDILATSVTWWWWCLISKISGLILWVFKSGLFNNSNMLIRFDSMAFWSGLFWWYFHLVWIYNMLIYFVSMLIWAVSFNNPTVLIRFL